MVGLYSFFYNNFYTLYYITYDAFYNMCFLFLAVLFLQLIIYLFLW